MKLVKIFLLILVFINFKSVKADDFYWVGGSGDWKDTSHWSSKSGGITNNSIPGSFDNVFFDAKSFTARGQYVKVNTLATCKNMDWSTVTNSPRIIDDADSDHYLSISGSLILSANMNFNFGQEIHFSSSSDDNKMILNGRSFKNDILFSGNGVWTVKDDMEIISGGIFHNRGNLIFEGDLRADFYNSTSSAARELSLNNSTMRIVATNGVAMKINTDNLIVNPGTSTIEFVSEGAIFEVEGNKGVVFNDILFNDNGFLVVRADLSATGYVSSTINHLEFLSSGSVSGNIVCGDFVLHGGNSYSILDDTKITVTGTFIAKGDCGNFSNISGGSNVIIDANNVDLNSLIVSDILAQGVASPFKAVDSFDNGNCNTATGWEIINTLPRTCIWTGNAGDTKWSNPNNWNVICVPTQIDDVVIKSGSIVNVDIEAFCKNMEISNGKTLTGSSQLTIYGNLNSSDATWSLNANVYFASKTDVTINMGGQNFDSDVYFTGEANYLLDSPLVLSASNLYLLSGNIISNTNELKANHFFSSGDLVRSLDLTGSIFTLTGNMWKVEGGNFAYTGGEILLLSEKTTFENNSTTDIAYAKLTFATLASDDMSELRNSSTSAKVSIDDLTFNSNSLISGNHTYRILKLNPGSSYELSTTSVQTITGNLNAIGSCSKFISIFSVDGQSTIFSDVDIDAQYCRIDNVKAEGTGNHNASGSIEIGGTSDTWNFVLPTSQDLYWTGAVDSNWFNSNNWKPSCVPTRVDNVFFDASEYSSTSSATVLVSGIGNKAECDNISFEKAGGNIKFTGTINLNVFGSLNLQGINPKDFVYDGDVYFKSINKEQISLAGCSFRKNVYFQGSKQTGGDWLAGEWDFLDDFTCEGGLILEQGIINTLDNSVTVSIFNSSFDKERTLNLANSHVYLKEFHVSPQNFFMNSGTSTFSFKKNPKITIAKNNNPVVFNDIIFLHNEGVGEIIAFSPSVKINNLTLNCNTNILGEGLVIENNLTLAQGKTYRFDTSVVSDKGGVDDDSKIYSIGNIIAVGGCDGAIDISTTTAGISTVIRSNNEITVTGIILKDIHVRGDFTANESIDLGNNDGWIINKAPLGKNIFWVGSTGSWDDKQHWSYTSGGAPGACIPTALDNVIFDEKSFSNPGQFLYTGTSDIRCKTMDWSSVLYSPTFKSRGDIYGIYIYGSLIFSDNMNVDLSSNIDFYFRASEKGQIIKTASYQLPGRVYFDGFDAISGEIGGWVLEDNFSVSKQVYLNNGFFKTEGYNLSVQAIYAEKGLGTKYKGLDRILDIANSLVTIQGDGLIIDGREEHGNALRVSSHDDESRDQSFDMIATNSTIIVENDASIYIIGTKRESFNFNSIEFKKAGVIDANRVNFTSKELIMRDNGSVLGNQTFTRLEFTKGKDYILDSDKTINVDEFVADGTCNFPISIESKFEGIAANIKNTKNDVKLNFIHLKDIHADISTGRTYTVDNAIDNGNNANWILNDRDPIDLFWVGNGLTDDWDDYNNWAKTSGGVGEACVPTKIDNVFFDVNSFLVNKKASINTYAQCNSITWTDNVDENSVFNINDTLEVHNNLKFTSNMSLNSLGVVMFKGLGSSIRNVDFANKSFDGDIIFDSEDDLFLLESGFINTADLKITAGIVNTQDNTLGLGKLIIDAEKKVCKLLLGNSKLIISSNDDKSVELKGDNISIDSNLSRIEFPNGGGLFYDSAVASLKLHDLIFDDNGIINIKSNGEAKFNNVKFAERSQIFGSNRFSSLELSIGYYNTIESDKIVFVENEFIMEGVTCERAFLSSSTEDTPAFLQSEKANINVYHASLKDIHAFSYGSADFSINGDYDDRLGNKGWKDKTPDDNDIEAPNFKQPMPDYIEYCSDKTEIDDVLSFPISKNTVFQWYKFIGHDWEIIPGETNAVLRVNENGKYRIELIYNPTCKLYSQIEIKIDSSVEKIKLAIEPINISCFKKADGSIRVLPSKGYPDYFYTWYDRNDKQLNVINTDIIIGLDPGEYRVVVTDSKSCSEEISAEIVEAAEIIDNGVNKTDINCFGDATGELSIDITGGAGKLEYSINGVFQAENNLSNLIAGDYAIYARDANKCVTTETTVSIIQPDKIVFDWMTSGLKCNGDSDGTINPQVSGGIPAYNYTWKGPNSLTSSEVGLSKLVGGIYSLTVTDANNCVANEDYNLEEPGKLNHTIAVSKLIKCNGDNKGQLFVQALEGTAPYSYTINSINNNTGIFSNLIAGNYNVNIEDFNGCISNFDYTIKQPNAIVLAVNDRVAPSCPLLKDGFISISAFEGTGEFKYSWIGPDDFRADSQNIYGLASGEYDLLVTDSLNCTKKLLVEIPKQIDLQLGLRVNNSVSKLNASDGSFSIEIIGGTPNYKFVVDGPSSYKFISPEDYYDNLFTLSGLSGGLYHVSLEDKSSCIVLHKTILVPEPSKVFAYIEELQAISCNSSSDASLGINIFGTTDYTVSWTSDNGYSGSGKTISSLAPGVYTAKVKTAGQEIIDVHTISKPEVLSAVVDNIVSPLCNAGKTARMELNINGGTPKYNVKWTGPNGFASKAAKLVNISSGAYSYTVTDANKCAVNGTTNISEPDKLKIDAIDIKDISAIGQKDGEIKWTVSGGTKEYVFFLSGQAPNDYTYKNPANSSGVDSRSSLRQGLYLLEVLDKNECREDKILKVHEPERLIVFPTEKINLICNGQSDGQIKIDVVKINSTISYSDKCSYLWEGPNFYKSTQQNISGLEAGKYKVTVTDKNNLEQVSLEIKLTQPEKLHLEYRQDNISCFGLQNGYINIFPSGGTAPYEYKWTGLDVSVESQDQSDLLPGDYSVNIVDANRCALDKVNFTISDIEDITINTELIQPTCYGINNGEISILVGDEKAPYSIEWNDYGSILFNLKDVYAREYTYTIKDKNSCEHTKQVKLDQPDKLEVEINDYEDSKCYGDGLAYANVDVSGGTPGYLFKWSNNQITANATNLVDGENKVIVTDSKLCVDSAYVNISNPKPLELQIEVKRPKTVNSNDGFISIKPQGGIADYTISWMQLSSADFRVNNLAPKVYEAYVEDANLCRRDTTLVLKELFVEKVIIPKAFSPNGDGVNDQWVIERVQYVLDLKLKIYDRWGKTIYDFSGSGFEYNDSKWTGLSSGNKLPSGTYYYSIEIDGEKSIIGSVAIVR